MGDRQQRLLWLDIPNRGVQRFGPETGSDDVFGMGKPVGLEYWIGYSDLRF